MSQPPVIFNEQALESGEGFIGCIHLNVPETFNSLTLEMVRLMQAQLDAWRDNENLCAIILDGEGEKAFCAGGDVKSLYNGREDKDGLIDNPGAIRFFDEEYQLDYSLHTFPKPIICWGTGVVMGGGLGLMTACQHRVMTETSRTAMPEITIGLFPDVGGSWFLNRSPGLTGLFLGLTGVNVNAHDAIFSGLANRFILSEFKQEVMTAMLGLDKTAFDQGALTIMLKSFQQKSESQLPESKLRQHLELINEVCDFEMLPEVAEEIIKRCETSEDDWLNKAAATLKAGCPVTAHLVFEQLKRARFMSLKEVFDMERKISAECMRHEDFYEGVRALLIDKDKNPSWSHKSFSEPEVEEIEAYFI